MILLQVRNDLGFADPNVRLAAHHAIDKDALSKAFYGGAAAPLSVVATPGTPGFLTDFKFEYSQDKAKAALAKSGFSPEKPAQIKFAATNGHFPSDYDIARAIQQMWKRVGIDAELETIEYAKYFELNRGAKLPEATLYSWDNATGDPEIFAGYLLNPKMPFSAWKGMDVGEKVLELFNIADYDKRIEGYRALNKSAVEAGATIPLLQSVVDGGAQEEPELREVRQRLDFGQHDGVVLIARCPARPRESGDPESGATAPGFPLSRE